MAARGLLISFIYRGMKKLRPHGLNYLENHISRAEAINFGFAAPDGISRKNIPCIKDTMPWLVDAIILNTISTQFTVPEELRYVTDG